jgi:hypothetical protein
MLSEAGRCGCSVHEAKPKPYLSALHVCATMVAYINAWKTKLILYDQEVRITRSAQSIHVCTFENTRGGDCEV